MLSNCTHRFQAADARRMPAVLQDRLKACGLRPLVARVLASRSTVVPSLVESCSDGNWKAPLDCQGEIIGTPAGAVVALGKFDAMHKGHASLAIRAAELGSQPYLLSFNGMAQVLGWPNRQPLVAECDRDRVLRSWSVLCHGQAVRQRYMPFACIRHMPPEEFIQLLAHDLRAVGVVAGTNYRFGYKASGTADTLVSLGAKYGLRVSIVDLLPSELPGDIGQVSSSKVREMLAVGQVEKVAQYLGRQYRTVLQLPAGFSAAAGANQPVMVPMRHALNQVPAAATYTARLCNMVVDAPGREIQEEALEQLGGSCEVQVNASGLILPAVALREAEHGCLVTLDFLTCKGSVATVS